MSDATSENPDEVDESTMTPDQRAELARERAVAENTLRELAAARDKAEQAYEKACEAIAVAWRANQRRPKSGRYTATAVARVTGVDRNKLSKWLDEDGKADKPAKRDGNYSLNDFEAFGDTRTATLDEYRAKTRELIDHWRATQTNPRTKMPLALVERLTGIKRPTLRAWLSGTHNPYGLKRTTAKDAVAGTGQRTVTVTRTTPPAGRGGDGGGNTGSGKRMTA